MLDLLHAALDWSGACARRPFWWADLAPDWVEGFYEKLYRHLALSAKAGRAERSGAATAPAIKPRRERLIFIGVIIRVIFGALRGCSEGMAAVLQIEQPQLRVAIRTFVENTIEALIKAQSITDF